jgi:uncharacterized OB-fold protein
MMALLEKPRAVVSSLNGPHFEALQDGRLVLQRCSACEAVLYYPRVVCPACLSTELVWTPMSGRGTLVSFSEVHKPQHPGFNEETPIPLIAVRLLEGPTMFGRLSRPISSSTAIGSPVEFDAQAARDAEGLPVFRLVSPKR